MEGLVNPKIIVVCGPTASGKTALAVALAKHFGGEMLGADSMQIYRGLTIGTAAITPQEAEGIPQHLVGFVAPERRYSVADYVADAHAAIAKILAKGALPVVCGGTGLYITSLLQGLAYQPDNANAALRQQLLQMWQLDNGDTLRATLAQKDAQAAARLHPNDKQRLVRALEAVIATGFTAAQRNAQSRLGGSRYTAFIIAPQFADRQMLYNRINQRVDAMVNTGLLQEAQLVYQHKNEYKTAAQAIGYKEWFPYFEQLATFDACCEKLKQASRNYAKRQLSWFRGMQEVNWLDASAADLPQRAISLAEDFLQNNASAINKT